MHMQKQRLIAKTLSHQTLLQKDKVNAFGSQHHFRKETIELNRTPGTFRNSSALRETVIDMQQLYENEGTVRDSQQS